MSDTIISGELDAEQREFTVMEIKNIPTESVWSENQVREMYDLVTKVKNSGEDSLIISTGMLPVLINRAEIEKLQQELQSILSSIASPFE
jgi:archaellum component FlaG (FlaF/FlaG flagellin family)